MDKYLKIFLIVTAFVVTGILAVYFSAMYWVDSTMIQADDPLMQTAAEQAQATMDTFYKLVDDYPDHSFVRYYYSTEEDDSLLVWGTVTAHSAQQIHNTVFDEYQDRVANRQQSIAAGEVVDWLIELPDGRVRGGFTSQVILIREKQSTGEANGQARIDSLLNLFQDPL